jgi:hypothetical protein
MKQPYFDAASSSTRAHPNVEGVDLSSQAIKSEVGGATLNTIYAHGPDAIVLAITDIINTMQLVCRLLLHSVSNRMRMLSIDQHFTADARFFVTLFEEHKRELAKREIAGE